MYGNTQADGFGESRVLVLNDNGELGINPNTGVAEAWVPAVQADTGTNSVDFIVPAGEKWALMGARVSLQTLTTAGNRRVEMQIISDDGTTIVWRNRTGVDQPISTTYEYMFAPGFTIATATAVETGYYQNHMPVPLIVPAQHTVRFIDKNNVDDTNDIMTVYLLMQSQNMDF